MIRWRVKTNKNFQANLQGYLTPTRIIHNQHNQTSLQEFFHRSTSYRQAASREGRVISAAGNRMALLRCIPTYLKGFQLLVLFSRTFYQGFPAWFLSSFLFILKPISLFTSCSPAFGAPWLPKPDVSLVVLTVVVLTLNCRWFTFCLLKAGINQ